MWIADLHIHSRYSRATSGECVPEYLELWAQRKGIDLLGTGDFTHPAWRQELREKLVPAEEGFYTLKEEFRLPEAFGLGHHPTRFVVTGEISSIYKKNDRVRKVHNLILLPSLEAADLLSRRLEAIGNIHSDGRPILGLDSRDLLEITLEACPEAVFIPAHIWTPHFALFGAFSGFDTIEECFEDLTPYIHSLETGLSSDPPMNWRVSALDRYLLVSNSDAHSPAKLGREANLFDCALSYPAMAAVLRGEDKSGFGGTIEFFPEEGKYHYDGHRNCGLCLKPAEADRYGGRCPVCGKKLTIGVQHRVEQLADRDEGFIPAGTGHFESLAPLPEVIAASTGLSATGKKVQEQYASLLHTLGSEFTILRSLPAEDIERVAGPCIAEGIRRLRAGQVERSPGYDGQYGTISLLTKEEIDRLSGQISFFQDAAPIKKKASAAKRAPVRKQAADVEKTDQTEGLLSGLNTEQQEAVLVGERAVAVVAGPGTGKTGTLVSRILHLLEQGIRPGQITAVTFTNKAAEEMRTRLEKQRGSKRAVRDMAIGTFHSLCLRELTAIRGTIILADDSETWELAAELLKEYGAKGAPRQFLQEVSRWKNGMPLQREEITEELCEAYNERLHGAGLLDFDDLLLETLQEWEGHADRENPGFDYLLVDEFQDINALQYRLVRAWNRNGKGLFVIGDPDQSIYGFRGADARCFDRLAADEPGLKLIRLKKNYRSTPNILNCALPMISHGGLVRELEAQRPWGQTVNLLITESDLAEGIHVAKEIGRMVGGIDMLEAQAVSLREREAPVRGFSDIAVLYRTHRQANLLEKCLRKEGIPYVVAGRDDYLLDDQVRGTLCFFRSLLDARDIPAVRISLKTLWDCPADLIESVETVWRAVVKDVLAADSLAEIKSEFAEVARLEKWIQMLERYLPRAKKAFPAALLEEWAAGIGGEGEAMERLLNTAVFHKDMPAFLQALSLGQEGDIRRSGSREYTAGAVTLSTLHASKGLEYPVVFLCGVCEGRIPLETAGRPADEEEERRLFYVGMTRAKDELILLCPGERSPFLADVPADALETGEAGRKRRPEAIQLSLF